MVDNSNKQQTHILKWSDFIIPMLNIFKEIEYWNFHKWTENQPKKENQIEI